MGARHQGIRSKERLKYHSARMLVPRITVAHLETSALTISPNAAGVITGRGAKPIVSLRSFTSGNAKVACGSSAMRARISTECNV